jgi:hypothetical protein
VLVLAGRGCHWHNSRIDAPVPSTLRKDLEEASLSALVLLARGVPVRLDHDMVAVQVCAAGAGRTVVMIGVRSDLLETLGLVVREHVGVVNVDRGVHYGLEISVNGVDGAPKHRNVVAVLEEIVDVEDGSLGR